MQRFHDLSAGIKIQILLGFLCLLLTLLVGGSWLFGWQQSAVLEHETELVDRMQRIGTVVEHIKDVQIDVIQVQQWLTDISATRGLDGLNDGLAKAGAHAERFRTAVDRLIAESGALELKGIKAALEDAKLHFEPYYETGQKMAQAYVAEGPSSGNRLMGEFDSVAERIGDDVSKLTDLAGAAARQAQADALALQADTSFFRNMLLVLGVIALAVCAGAVIFTRILDRQAIAEQQRAAQLRAERDRQAEDELQRAAAAQAEREREATEKAQIASLVIGELGRGLEQLSKGNLSHRIRTAFPQDFDHLRKAFNQSAEALADTVLSVKSGAVGIRAGSGEIAVASDDLSRRTETQAASLEETAAAVAQIAATVRKTAEGAAQARDVVAAAKVDADKGGDVVNRAVSAMGNIERSSNQIHQIISVIDEIAFQTNLLALNAGVEAARAGETGRGFAVVASEVRALAQRSADAAKEIKELLTASRNEVEHGVTLVSETGVALGRIVERIAAINASIAEIASSAEQQSAGLQEVNVAIDSLDQVTQQNAAMVEQANAATRNLSEQSMVLADIVGRFSTEPADRRVA